MRKIAIIACILFLFTGLALAQIPTAGNVFFGYSYFNNNLSSIGRAGINGWEGSLEGKVLPFIGIVADFSGHYGSETFQGAVCPVGDPPCLPSQFSANVSEHNFLFGPRVSVKLGRFRPFAEAMAGAGHVNVNSVGTDNSFATAVGGWPGLLPGASRATMCAPVSSAHIRTTSAFPPELFCASKGRTLLQTKAGSSWLAESCFLWPLQNLARQTREA
jgi:hypothetical protein